MPIGVKQVGARVGQKRAILDRMRGEIQKVIVGREELIERLLVGLIGNNHILVDGLQGLRLGLCPSPLCL